MAKVIILVVEDEVVLSRILARKLGRRNFEVVVAGNGVEALKQMRKVKPQLVLLDLIMPEKNGFEVLEEAKADKELKEIPIVVFSNLGQEEDRQKAKKLGAIDYLVKANLSVAEVTEVVDKYLRK